MSVFSFLGATIVTMFFQVTTEDGYVLSLQRIPFGRSGRSSDHRQPVLVQHGLMMVWALPFFSIHFAPVLNLIFKDLSLADLDNM